MKARRTPDIDHGRPRDTPAGRSAVRRFLPAQHGAWVILVLPWLAGVLTTGLRWPHLPLLVAWLAGYLFTYYLLLAVKTRRTDRVRAQLLAHGIPTVVFGLVTIAARPQLLWYVPAFALLLTINISSAARGAERALYNGLASVVQSCLMVFVCATVAAIPPGRVTTTFLTVAGYLVGTVLHVKTMIRERGNPRYRWASIGYHLAAFTGALLAGPLASGVFALLLVRTAVLPRYRIAPSLIGAVEFAGTALILLVVIAS